MQKELESIEELKLCSEKATTVLNETKQYLQEMKDHELMTGEEAIASIFTSTTVEEIKRALNKRPTAVFIGNRNCGKSAVLNEILGGSYLPVDETPCTSRIVKMSYTPGKNTVRVVDKRGQVKSSITIGKRVPQDYVVVCDEGREKSDQLKCTVEIALNHPFLKSGIELIDSPGRNENDALDEVVDDFFEKDTTPFVVYIIDGNEHLRSSVSISFTVESINPIYMPVTLG